VPFSEKRLHTISKALASISLLLMIGSQFLFALNRETSVPASWAHPGGARTSLAAWLNFGSLSVVIPVVAGLLGTLVVSKHSRHPIGWILAALGMFSALVTFAGEWAIYGYYTSPGGLPGAILAAWFINWAWLITISLLMWMLAIFPDGKLKSGFWGTAFILSYSVFFLSLFIGSQFEANFSSGYQIPNLIITQRLEGVYDLLFSIGIPAMPLTALVLVGTIWVRWQHSTRVMRQQIKWLIVGVGFMTFLISAGLLLIVVSGLTLGEQMVNNSTIVPLAAISIAITRYRLYDIDIIIRRTLVYALVTILLAGVYLGGVTILQALFNTVAGQQSALTIVLSTLAIAALFNPLRQRVQIFIDHRFYRRRYDAEQALAEFATAARNEVEIDSLADELLSIVTQTVQPESASLWLKPSAEHKNVEPTPGSSLLEG
jgi:hypothetical protein